MSTVWRKSSHSGVNENTDCVEVARLGGCIGVRDSKAPASGHLSLSAASFGELLARVRRGELGLPPGA